MALDGCASYLTMLDLMPWISPEHVERQPDSRRPPDAEADARTSAARGAVNARSRPDADRVRTAGKFFALGREQAYPLRAVIYGPFPPNAAGEFFPERDALARDLRDIRELGANCLRIFHHPTPDLLEACGEADLRLIVTHPWAQHIDFLADKTAAHAIVQGFRELVRSLAGDSRILAYLVGNEVPPDIVRWRGVQAVRDFLESLVDAGRAEDPGALFSYANFPPTEYLQPRNLDFICFNVYLHEDERLEAYLRRLHHLAGNLPLVIGEFGMDSAGQGEEAQADYYRHQTSILRDLAVAGEAAFSYCDEWYTGGRLIEDWSFGLVRRDRSHKPAWDALKKAWAAPPRLSAEPKVSVIICAHNAAPTLRACLDSLRNLHYANYEVLLVDDGSRDSTPEIARDFPEIRYLPIPHTGLSAARNHGAALATGSVLAYMDADCQAHPLWLHYAVQALLQGDFAATGGPNIPPPALNRAQACVAAAPGGPREVMLDDLVAEHLPGCNLVVWKSAFEAIGGFDPQFHTAGDDVDFCWRLSAAGYRMGFHPGAMVWHERRRDVAAYYRQQRGYGRAEALLWHKHQQAFGGWGTVRWKGRIYEPARPELLASPRVYTGRFGDALFQSIYTQAGSRLGRGSFEWFTLATAWLLADLAWGNIPLVPVLLFAYILGAAATSARAAHLEASYDQPASRRLLHRLCLWQPIIRGFSRWWDWLLLTRLPQVPGGPVTRDHKKQFTFWSQTGVDKHALLANLPRKLEEWKIPHGISDGWRDWDLRLLASPFVALYLHSATEYHGEGRNLLRLSYRINPTAAGLATWLLGVIVILGLLARFLGVEIACAGCIALACLFLAWLGWLGYRLRHILQRALAETTRELNLGRI